MASEKPRVLLVHNYPTPYRMPLFESLAATLELDVWFCQGHDATRRWVTAPSLQHAHERILPAIRLGPLIINWSLPLRLMETDVEAIVLAEDLSTIFASVVVCLYGLARRVPIVLWSEHVPHEVASRRLGERLQRLAYRRLRKWILSRSASVVAMSGAASLRQVRELGRIDHVWSGTQILPPPYLPAPTGAKRSETIRLLFIGYLRPEKNVVELIGAFRSLAYPEAELVIAGDGPERGRVEAAAAGASNVRIVGHIDGHSKAQQIEEASVLVLPSTYEPWGLVVNEALSLGTPVLLSRFAGAADLIMDGENGLTFDRASEHRTLERVLERFLSDEGLRARLLTGASQVSREQLSGIDVGLSHLRAGISEVLGYGVEPVSSPRTEV